MASNGESVTEQNSISIRINTLLDRLAAQSAWRAAAIVVAAALALALGLATTAQAAGPVSCASLSCRSEATLASESYQPAANERWIEVDLGRHEVLLHEGARVIKTLPAATGRNDTPGTTTYPGIYEVYRKSRILQYLEGEKVYIRDWVAFDAEWANGFHSFPLDEYGKVLDARVREGLSSGCVRTADSSFVYNFAEIGMTVFVRSAPERISLERDFDLFPNSLYGQRVALNRR